MAQHRRTHGGANVLDLDQFIADLRVALTERSRQAAKEVVARVVSDPAALLRCIGEPEKPSLQILHRAPDLTVLNVVWSPKQVTLPHDHRMAAIIGIYGGREDNMFWRRISNPSRFQIAVAGGQALGTGDVTILGRDVIHSVVNPLAKLSGAIHVYDGDFLAQQRSMWDAETLVEAPYDVAIVAAAAAMPVPA
jgi:predicted metal-dependent enzyme (double-stranded beta helix superfamily)